MNRIPKILLGLATLTLLQGCALFSAAGLSSQGPPVKKVTPSLLSAAESSSENIDHSLWDDLLKDHVGKDGMVDYKGFAKDRDALQEYLSMLSEQQPTDDWSVQELLAYYINLYNAHTVELILDNYPVKSIKDINGPWTKAIVLIGKKKLSLGGIENGILRKMNEPRIHFAINCASISCPNLLNEAYTADKINDQLGYASTQFINGDKNELSENHVRLSSIFKWYEKDYLVNGTEDIIAYINQFSKIKINKGASIEYLDYNWNLNER